MGRKEGHIWLGKSESPQGDGDPPPGKGQRASETPCHVPLAAQCSTPWGYGELGVGGGGWRLPGTASGGGTPAPTPKPLDCRGLQTQARRPWDMVENPSSSLHLTGLVLTRKALELKVKKRKGTECYKGRGHSLQRLSSLSPGSLEPVRQKET